MIIKSQIIMIKMLQKKLELSDDEYKAILSGFGVDSCKDLSFSDAKILVDKLQAEAIAKGIWNQRKPKILKRFENLGKRKGMASPAQLRMIESMWCGVSTQPTLEDKQAAFHIFLRNRFKIERIEWLPSNMIGRVVTTIKAMQGQGK